MRIYLHQPFYGASYVIGKVQIDRLMADRACQLGDEFRLKEFMDEFIGAGLIPMSLIRWQMTGLDDEMKRMLKSPGDRRLSSRAAIRRAAKKNPKN
jgi:hypothetical protein